MRVMPVVTAPISVTNLTYRYRSGVPVFESLTFSVAPGDYVGLIGPNGSGKTTLIKLLLGLLPLQSGTVELFGRPRDAFHEWDRIGYVPQTVFQGDSNFPALVSEVVAAGHLASSVMQTQAEHQKLTQALERVVKLTNISHLLKRRIGELSSGEQQRVFIAQALVSDPALLVLDEPTAGIDLSAEQSFYDLLRELNERHGKTILLISHDLEALAHNAQTAFCLNKRLVYYGPAQGLHEPAVVEAVFGRHAWHSHTTDSI